MTNDTKLLTLPIMNKETNIYDNDDVVVEVGGRTSGVIKKKDVTSYVDGLFEDISSNMKKRGFQTYLSSIVVMKLKDVESYLSGLLDDVTSNMNKSGFETTLCDVYDDIVFIYFGSKDYVDDMMKEVLRYENKVNGSGFVRETLWDFLEKECLLEIVYSDCSDIDCEIIDDGVRLTFTKELLPRFKELFFEVFPKENIQQVSNQ